MYCAERGVTKTTIRVWYYVPSVQQVLPADQLYCCTECNTLLCDKDVVDEVEAYQCFQCLETLQKTEAFAYKQCCFRCFDCPRCSNVLTYVSSAKTKAVTTQHELQAEYKTPHRERDLPAAEGRKTQKPPLKTAGAGKKAAAEKKTTVAKEEPEGNDEDVVFQLVCQYCRWNSAHLGIETNQMETFITRLSKLLRGARPAQSIFDQLIHTLRTHLQDEHWKNYRFGGLYNSPSWTDMEYTASNPRMVAETRRAIKDTHMKQFSIWDDCIIQRSLTGLASTPQLGTFSKSDRMSHLPLFRDSGSSVLGDGTEQEAAWKQRMLLLDDTSLCSVPTLDHLLDHPYSIMMHDLSEKKISDLVLPRPKPLHMKRSRRCKTCKRYVIHGHHGLRSGFRLNLSAVAVLPVIILKRLTLSQRRLPESGSEDPVRRAFPQLCFGDEAQLDIEVMNVLDTASVTVEFHFEERAENTVECLNEDVTLTLDSYDELVDEEYDAEQLSARDTEGAERAENGLIESQRPSLPPHRQRLQLRLRVPESVSNLSSASSALVVAQCGFRMTLSTLPSLVLTTYPVLILGSVLPPSV